jgi:hypothetical protein
MKKIIILIIALFAQIIQANCSDELIDTVKIGLCLRGSFSGLITVAGMGLYAPQQIRQEE